MEINKQIIHWPYDVTNKNFLPPSIVFWQYLDTEYVGWLEDIFLMKILWKS